MHSTGNRVEYGGGNYYVGEFKEEEDLSIPHGRGVFTWMNGDVHDGTFVDGKIRQGVLKQLLQNGRSVEYSYSNFVRQENCQCVGKSTDVFRIYDLVEAVDPLANGHCEKLFISGDIYRGELANGEPNGKGTLTGVTGKYEGDFVDGRPHGKGICTYANGDVLDGNFVDGIADGRGVLTKPVGYNKHGHSKLQPQLKFLAMHSTGNRVEYGGGNYYVGEFKEEEDLSIPHGRGVFTWMNGDVHDGTFVDGKIRQGVLKQLLQNGRSVEYSYSNFVRQENCQCVGKSTDVFRIYDLVEAVDPLANGHCEKLFISGDIYRGELANGEPNGKGTLTGVTGKYEGDFVDGRPHGKGICTYANGDVLDGNFVDGIANGRGVLTKPDGCRYDGGFKDGMEHGFGEAWIEEGTLFSMSYTEGKANGKGHCTYFDGSRYDVEFKDDELISSTLVSFPVCVRVSVSSFLSSFRPHLILS